MGSTYGADAHRNVDGMDGLRALHGFPLYLSFGVGDSLCAVVHRSFGVGSASVLQVCLPDGMPF